MLHINSCSNGSITSKGERNADSPLDLGLPGMLAEAGILWKDALQCAMSHH